MRGPLKPEADTPTFSSRFHKIRLAKKGDPLVRRIFEEMNLQQCSGDMLEKRSGVDFSSVQKWRNGANPKLHNLRAVLQALGLKLYTKGMG
jgi:hypothetical protein